MVWIDRIVIFIVLCAILFGAKSCVCAIARSSEELEDSRRAVENAACSKAGYKNPSWSVTGIKLPPAQFYCQDNKGELHHMAPPWNRQYY